MSWAPLSDDCILHIFSMAKNLRKLELSGQQRRLTDDGTATGCCLNRVFWLALACWLGFLAGLLAFLLASLFLNFFWLAYLISIWLAFFYFLPGFLPGFLLSFLLGFLLNFYFGLLVRCWALLSVFCSHYLFPFVSQASSCLLHVHGICVL